MSNISVLLSHCLYHITTIKLMFIQTTPRCMKLIKLSILKGNSFKTYAKNLLVLLLVLIHRTVIWAKNYCIYSETQADEFRAIK